MSIRISRPLRRRVCEGCSRPIIRNLAIVDDTPWHFGCLKRSDVEPTWQCMDCFAYLTGPWTSIVYVGGRETRGCRRCGSGNVVRIRGFPWGRRVGVAVR